MKKQAVDINYEQSQNIVDGIIELHNEMNQSFYDLDSLRRIFIKTCVSDYFLKDNPSKCDTGSVLHGPVLMKRRLKGKF